MKRQLFNDILDTQFGAALAMLRNAIAAFPTEAWDDAKPYWYNAYHCLFFTDFYLTEDAGAFDPPFGEGEFDEILPDPPPTRAGLLAYADELRARCAARIAALTDENAGELWFNQSRTRSFPVVELHIYNLRHVQHHAAQVNLLLRQGGVAPPGWVSRAGDAE